MELIKKKTDCAMIMIRRAMKNLAEIIGKPIDELIGIIIHQDEFFLNLQKINAILTAET
ncbi:MAG: hypothetical protein GY751_17495 [Bacteroidetes bacterium]|nr:hypothetical protein [Bacteroidota bacterium]